MTTLQTQVVGGNSASEVVIRLQPNSLPQLEITTASGLKHYKTVQHHDLLKLYDASIVVKQLENSDHHYTEIPQVPNHTLFVKTDECAQYTDITVTGWVPSFEYPFLYGDESYLIQVPTMVYKMRWRKNEQRVKNFQLAVTPDETVTPDTLLYRWPFSNVLSGQSVCWTAQSFSCELHQLVELGVYGFLQTPNNTDGFGIGLSQNSEYGAYDEFLQAVQERGSVPTEWLIPTQLTVQDLQNNN